MYEIRYTSEATADLASLRKFDRETILDQVDAYLKYEPDIETRNRKRLKPNTIADWELRLGKYRVLYDVEEEVKIVAIQAVGIKIGNQLFIRNEKAEL
ncbi:MAG: type II toxin-antitoxin system RelE family toxin [Chloroflexota bacterium]